VKVKEMLKTDDQSVKNMSLQEMLRVMDVATELRQQRESVEREFAVDETKRILRERLLKANELTGEKLTEADVDAAIDRYFQTLYTYSDPPNSWKVWLARLYVNRSGLLALITFFFVLMGLCWLVLRGLGFSMI